MGFSYIVYLDAGCDVSSRHLRKLLTWFVDQGKFDLVLSRTGHGIAQYTKPNAIEYFRKDLIDAVHDYGRLEIL